LVGIINYMFFRSEVNIFLIINFFWY
jgi:hypothetical protein